MEVCNYEWYIDSAQVYVLNLWEYIYIYIYIYMCVCVCVKLLDRISHSR
jgi:hypothetical protein